MSGDCTDEPPADNARIARILAVLLAFALISNFPLARMTINHLDECYDYIGYYHIYKMKKRQIETVM